MHWKQDIAVSNVVKDHGAWVGTYFCVMLFISQIFVSRLLELHSSA